MQIVKGCCEMRHRRILRQPFSEGEAWMETLHFTAAQEQIAELHKVYSSKGICNIAGRIRFAGTYGRELLMKAILCLIDEIPAFRLSLNEKGEPILLEPEVELRLWPGSEAPTMEQLSHWVQIPFPGENAPLCGFMYYEAENLTELYIKVHHLLFDSYGVVLCVNRLVDMIETLDRGEDIKVHTDWRFIESMKAAPAVSEKAVEWYRSQCPKELSRSWIQKESRYGRLEARRKRYRILGENFWRLKRAEKEHGSSLEIMFSAAAAVYFSRITGTNFYCYGRSLVNRRKPEMDLPGMMANTLPVFAEIRREEEFWELCKYLKSFFYQMMRYSNLSYHELSRALSFQGALYDLMITFRRQKLIPFVKGVEQNEIYNLQLEIPLRIYIDELEEELRLDFLYQTECYDEREIDALFSRLLTVLNQGIEGRKLGEISIMTPEDIRLWDRIQPGEQEIPKVPIPYQIIRQAAASPDKTAFCFHGRNCSYGQLAALSDAMGAFLIQNGVRPGDLVGICLKDPVLAPPAVLGIWKAGAAFLPVSIKENEERIVRIRQMCAFFLTDEDARRGFRCRAEAIYPEICPEMPAYSMFTSGSTGKAKAAVISHQSLACRIKWMQDTYHCADSVLQKASCTFDVSVWEYFLPLAYGGCVYLTSEEEKRDPGILLEKLKKYRIETVHFVPSLLGVWLKYVQRQGEKLPHLKHVFASGEALSPELVSFFYECLPHAELHNLYGPTECTIDVTYYDCKKEDRKIPIGRPVSWTDVRILNRQKEYLPPGIEGELSVRGLLVGEGYYGQKSDRFREDEPGIRIYDTGDRAMLGFDGQIYYLGRNDGQCKIRGMRVDLEQIESVIREFPGVLRAAVLFFENQIAGFYMAEKPLEGLEGHLKASLPYYSIPQQIIYCKNIPLTANGKTDRSYLTGLLKKPGLAMPENEKEKAVWRAVKEKTGHSISVNDNLFLAGVDSLTVMELVLELEKLGMKFTPEDFYRSLTIRKLVRSGSRGYQWLTKQDGRTLVAAFPYAAGKPDDFSKLAGQLRHKKIDFCVARDVRQIPGIHSYEKIVLLGYCTGTADALKAAEYLIESGRPVCGVILCAAIPPGQKAARWGTPWRFVKDREISRFLNWLHRRPYHMDSASIMQFRRDTNHFFEYFRKSTGSLPLKAELFFGERDILTFPCGYRSKSWEKFFAEGVKCHILKNRGHFFLEECSRLLAASVCAMMKGEDK